MSVLLNRPAARMVLLAVVLACVPMNAIGAAADVPPTPEWAKDLIIYEIAPKAFTSPNGPESGTFNSKKKKLPYLKELGINAIWLAGYNLADSKHFYNIWTQYAVVRHDQLDPSLGTPTDFKAFIAEAHRNGIRVFLDVITHGVMNYSPLIKEHPEWFKGGTFNMTDFDWSGNHKDLDDWWVKTFTNYVTEYGVDGFRLDVAVGRVDLWKQIKTNADRANHPIVVYLELWQNYPLEGMDDGLDFYQRLGKSADQVVGIDHSVKLNSNVAAYYREFKAPGKVLFNTQLSCHDDGWEGFPSDGNPYVAEGSRCVFGYSCLFTPAIPSFMSGEEFNADYRERTLQLSSENRSGQNRWRRAGCLEDSARERALVVSCKRRVGVGPRAPANCAIGP